MERLEVTFSKAVIKLTLDHPFLAQIYYGVPNEVVDDPNMPTACTTGRKRMYNREFMTAQPKDIQAFVVAHEVMHDMLEHPFRRGNRRPDVWNYAIDYKVNQLLDESGLTLWPNCLRDKKFDDMTEEAIYDELMKDPPPPSEGKGGQGSGQFDEHMDAEGTPEEIQQARQEAQARVLQAAAVAKQMGSLPAYAKGLVDQILCPKEKWYEYLRRFFSARSWADYTHTIINRRELIRTNMVAPTLYSETLGHVVIGVDQSGSINDAMLSAFAAHVSDILQDTRPELCTVLYFDTQVSEEREEYTVNECAEAEKLSAEVLLVLTDMCGTFPEQCSVPTIWCSTESAETTVPFGEVIHVECE
jgi:predicted metal-dependent peptidase